MILGNTKRFVVKNKRSYLVSTENGYNSAECKNDDFHFLYYKVRNGEVKTFVEMEEMLRDEKIVSTKGTNSEIKNLKIYFDIH